MKTYLVSIRQFGKMPEECTIFAKTSSEAVLKVVKLKGIKNSYSASVRLPGGSTKLF